MTPHIPALRRGTSYESLDTGDLLNPRTGQVMAKISQVNAGIIKKDLAKIGQSFAALKRLTTTQLLSICNKAGDLFLTGELPIGDPNGGGVTQSPHQYIESLSATSGLPHVMVRRNMAKIHEVLTQMGTILRGLTRGMDLSVLDAGMGELDGAGGARMPVSFYPTTQSLGVVLPSNSPGVNSIWIPAVALKMPVVLKPGREEPWTPMRIIQSLIAAGCPAEAFSFYPTDHDGAQTILKTCGRALLFGDESTTAPYSSNPAIQIHGPGRSKILIGEDMIDDWRKFLDVLVESVAANGGRSCVNASAIVVPRHAKQIAQAVGERLAKMFPTDAVDENAKLSAFANPKMADWIESTINEGLQTTGAEDVTATLRGKTERKVVQNGATYLLPTLVACDSFDHPLANREFLFPYASVVEVPQREMLSKIGPSLVVTAITRDPQFIDELLVSPLIDRLNLGPVPTGRVTWDQPHEGNLFEFLYKRRAIQTLAFA